MSSYAVAVRPDNVSQTDWCLHLLRRGPRCGPELVIAGVGYRYSARIGNLREKGFEIDSDSRCRRHDHKSRLVLFVLEGWGERQGTLL